MSRYARKAGPIEPPFGVVRVEAAPKVALVFTAPIHIIPETNQREHWGAKAKRVKKQRGWGVMFTNMALRRIWPDGRHLGSQREPFLPVDVTLTRIIGPRGRKLDAGDNRNTAFKAVRDGIADALRVNDGDESRVSWRYEEEKGPGWAVRIRIEKRGP
jgi:hypothetical protein